METENINHYYGDIVRMLFIASGLIMIVSYPFFSSFIQAPIAFSIIGFVLLAILGGLINPKQKWIIFLDTLVSVIAFIIFEYAAVYTYLNLSPVQSAHVIFFWVNQLLSIIFFFAAYLSTKTLRGSMLRA